MPESVYIHIPFCKSKCKYCSFVSLTDLTYKTGYILSLLKEIDYYYNGEKLKTLYIGGGTPSLLNQNELKKIISKFDIDENTEITIEVNPCDITSDYAKILSDLGFNRISMGGQTFDDDILKYIGRRHSSKEIYKSIDILKYNGFENISLDLIYGLPEQSLKSFEKDLNNTFNLDLSHISLYGLKIDENCYFYNNMPQNISNDDEQADMYLLANELTQKNGFLHYEISNYAKFGCESKHNTNYWNCGEYYGFGLSAHGYNENMRYSNYSNLNEYLNSPTTHEYGKYLTENEKLEERIFLGLRLAKGIDISAINKQFNIDFEKKYNIQLSKYLNSGHILKTDFGYKFNDNKDRNGFLLSNIILADFIES